MLNLESTSSRMSHLARQEIYFDRQFGLDETLEGVERVTLRRRAARGAGPVRRRRARGDGARRGQRPGASTGEAVARMTAAIDDPTVHHPEMGRIWSDQRKYETWLQVEIAAADAMARAGIVPAEAARDIRERGAFDIARIEEIEQVTQHDVIAFTTAVAEHVGPSARWLHFGLTSSDVIDTAQALQMREACDLILTGSRRPDAGRARARRGASPHADDRPHARRARRADDVRPEAGALVRGAGARRRARAPRARDDRRSASCRAPSARSRTCRRRSKPTSAAASGSSRRRSRRR